MDKIDIELLKQIADLESVPEGSYNLRKNGKTVARVSNADITINSKTDKPGIDIIVKPGLKGKSVHIPVIVTESGLKDLVYNDFYIGEDSDVLIVAGCGIHNESNLTSGHDGIHTFYIGKNAKVKYVEKHLGIGKKQNGKILNPTTNVFMEEGSEFEMETQQLGGVTSADRVTNAEVGDNAKLNIREKILTTEDQWAQTNFKVNLKGDNSSVKVVSRSVAKDNSKQKFVSNIEGNANCFGHVECDGIILNNAQIASIPEIDAKNVNASLVHEAAIGKIAGDQLIKLMTLGLDQTEAENLIIKGYLN